MRTVLSNSYLECLKETGLDKDIPLIDEYVKRYSKVDNPIPMKEYLEHWYDAKRDYLLKLFNNQLIIEEPVEFNEPFDAIHKKIAQLINSPAWETAIIDPVTKILEALLFDGDTYMQAVGFKSSRSRTWQREHENERYFFIGFLNIIRDPFIFTKNEIQRSIALSPAPTNYFPKHFYCSYETRPFKMLRSFVKMAEPICTQLQPEYFTSDFFNDLYAAIETYRVWQSQCLNVKKITGTLCLSIHPMDYLTMSDNNYGWHSCLNWTNTKVGEFRAGTLEMLTSPYVIIAYLKGKKPWNPCGPDRESWNNKKWRQLFIIHPQVIAGIKGYPYQANNLTRLILNKLNALCGNVYGDIQDTYDTGCKFQDKYLYFYTNAMYNDTDSNDFLYMTAKQPDESDFDDVRPDEVSLNYSGPAYCLECDTTFVLDSNYDECSGLTCCHCDTHERCHECHSILDETNPAYKFDGHLFCEQCAEDLGYFDYI